MKKFSFISLLLLTFSAFISCGEANVSGKSFADPNYGLEIHFAEKSDKVFYLSLVSTYKVEGKNIVINVNGKDMKLLYKDKTLTIYDMDENGNQTDKISKDSLILRLTDTSRRIDDFINLMRDFKILEICRTGCVSLEKGGSTIRKVTNF